MTLLSVVQEVALLANIRRPTSIASSGDPEILQMRALANVEGRQLARRHDWRSLIREHSFVTVAERNQPGSLPDDFRKMVDDTMWRGDSSEPVYGPSSAQFSAWSRATNGPTYGSNFRLVGNAIQIMPTPSAGTIYSYEYITSHWAFDVGTGRPASSLDNDNDTFSLPEELLLLGTLWRWKKSKGFDYGEELVDYETTLARIASEDRGMAQISFNRRRGLPDGVWPAEIRGPAI